MFRAIYRTIPPAVRRRLDVRMPPLVRQLRVPVPGGQAAVFDRLQTSEMFKRLFWRGFAGYEPETSSALLVLARQARTILDVGAYVGYCSIVMARANPKARIFSFEALAENANLMRHYLDLNGISSVEIVDRAVSDSDGSARFYVPDRSHSRHPAISSLVDRFQAGRTFSDRGSVARDVATVTLDSFCEDRALDDVDLVKIDVEETEDRVLAGAEKLLAAFHPDIIMEIVGGGQCDVGQIETQLRDHGYRFFSLETGSIVERDRLVDTELGRVNARGAWGEMFATAQPGKRKPLIADMQVVLTALG